MIQKPFYFYFICVIFIGYTGQGSDFNSTFSKKAIRTLGGGGTKNRVGRVS